MKITTQEYLALAVANYSTDGAIAELFTKEIKVDFTVCPECELSGFLHADGCVLKEEYDDIIDDGSITKPAKKKKPVVQKSADIIYDVDGNGYCIACGKELEIRDGDIRFCENRKCRNCGIIMALSFKTKPLDKELLLPTNLD
jgi:predicted RNA-binding Zn-ribbon protein involved in translation (DUF1610 family)